MTTKSRRAKPAVSKAKIALVAVLAVAMTAVWGRALLPSSPATPKPSASRRARKPAVAPAAKAPAEKPTVKQAVDWPTMTLADAVLNDPFAKPAWAIPPEPERPAPAAAQASVAELAKERLQQAGVSLVMISGDAKVAVVGDREVRVGDSIEGFRVIDITPGGIVLAGGSKPPPTNAPDAASAAPPTPPSPL